MITLTEASAGIAPWQAQLQWAFNIVGVIASAAIALLAVLIASRAARDTKQARLDAERAAAEREMTTAQHEARKIIWEHVLDSATAHTGHFLITNASEAPILDLTFISGWAPTTATYRDHTDHEVPVMAYFGPLSGTIEHKRVLRANETWKVHGEWMSSGAPLSQNIRIRANDAYAELRWKDGAQRSWSTDGGQGPVPEVQIQD